MRISCAIFALKSNFFRTSQEGAIGFGCLLASGIVVIIGSLVNHEARDITDILFGSAVVVGPKEVYMLPAVAFLYILIHRVFFKDFIIVSFDPETARLFNYPVGILNTVLLLTIGVVIAVATRALGALPVFALAVLPLIGCSKYNQLRKSLDFLKTVSFPCDVVQVRESDMFHCQLSNRDTEKIKLIGVEIPKAIEEKATAITKSLLKRRTTVKLEFDEETRDSFGRILAYVYLPGGEILNGLLIQ